MSGIVDSKLIFMWTDINCFQPFGSLQSLLSVNDAVRMCKNAD